MGKYNNFIDEVRALTKENEKLPFSERYPYIANEIYKAARQGYHSCFYMLNNNEINDLRAEGLTVKMIIILIFLKLVGSVISFFVSTP